MRWSSTVPVRRDVEEGGRCCQTAPVFPLHGEAHRVFPMVKQFTLLLWHRRWTSLSCRCRRECGKWSCRATFRIKLSQSEPTADWNHFYYFVCIRVMDNPKLILFFHKNVSKYSLREVFELQLPCSLVVRGSALPSGGQHTTRGLVLPSLSRSSSMSRLFVAEAHTSVHT